MVRALSGPTLIADDRRGELPTPEPLDKISLNDSPDWQASGDYREYFLGRDAALSFVGIDSQTGPLLVFIMPSTWIAAVFAIAA